MLNANSECAGLVKPFQEKNLQTEKIVIDSFRVLHKLCKIRVMCIHAGQLDQLRQQVFEKVLQVSLLAQNH